MRVALYFVFVSAAAFLFLPSLANAEATQAPAAFYEFCARSPAQCTPRGRPVSAMPMTPHRWAELREVNQAVNGSLREETDEEIYGRDDVWAIPTNGVGDCEDFALLKRERLLEAGWPSSVLLMTVVRNRYSEGHAVLTVVTDQGDYILDNRTGRVMTVDQTGYTYFSRQAQSDPRAWVVVPRDGHMNEAAPKSSLTAATDARGLSQRAK